MRSNVSSTAAAWFRSWWHRGNPRCSGRLAFDGDRTEREDLFEVARLDREHDTAGVIPAHNVAAFDYVVQKPVRVALAHTIGCHAWAQP